jgi:hypothetical protein
MADSPIAGAEALGSTASKHIIWAILILVAVVILTMRLRVTLGTFALKYPTSVGKVLGVTAVVTALAIGVLGLLAPSSALAATCCGGPALVAHGGHLWSWLAWLGATGLAGLALGMVGVQAPDTIDANQLNGQNQFLANFSVPATGSPSVEFYVNGTVPLSSPGGKPLCAVAEVLELTETIEQGESPTAAIKDEDLAQTVAQVSMYERKYLGQIMDMTVGTGPIVKHLIEFLGLGFNRGSDAPVATISDSAGASAQYTRYFTIPHTQNFFRRPMASSLWLGLIDQMKITVQLSPADALGGGAGVTGTSVLKCSTAVVPNPVWEWPLIVQHILEQIQAGSQQIKMLRFGEANAVGTIPKDFVFSIALLSSLVGLGGNVTFDQILTIDCPGLGISSANMQNGLPSFLKARFDSQQYGRGPMGYDQNGNYIQDVVPTGMNCEAVKFLLLKQPSMGMDLRGTLKAGHGYQLPITFQYSGAIPTTQHQIVTSSFRELQGSLGPKLAALPGSKLNPSPKASARGA